MQVCLQCMCACNTCVPAMHLSKSCSTPAAPQACQVPGRARCQGGHPETDAPDAHEQEDKHGEHAQRAHTTRRDETREQEISITTVTCQVPRRAKCQGEPSAKAPQAVTTVRNTRATQQRRTHSRAADAQRFTEAEAHVPSAKACQVPGRAKCQGVCAGGWARAMRA